MRTFCTFLFLLGMLSGTHAQDMPRHPYRQNTSHMSISSLYGSNLRVTIDNRTYTLNSGNNNTELYLDDLTPGYHRVRISRMPSRMRGGGHGNPTTQWLFNSEVYLKDNYQTDIVVNRFGRIFKDEQSLYGYDQQQGNYPDQEPVCEEAMDPYSFNALKTTLSRESFNDSRLTIAKQAAWGNYFTTMQVKEIMALFSFDESKLDIAKTYYSRTLDRQNYFVVNDVFTFSRSKEDLMKFISENP